MRALPVPALLLLAGCLASGPALLVEPAALEGVRIVGPDGAAVPFAAATAMGPAGALAVLSADADGLLPPSLLPPDTTRLVVAAPGLAADVATPLPATLRLAPLEGALAPDDDAPVLRFLPPVDLGGAALAHEATCARYNCGLSEPSVEVAGDGTIYYSAVCCIGRTPPVWASRDGGATWTALESRVRDLTGIEGDFAIDDAGNVYFTDILVGAGWFTSWDKDGHERYTLPLPFEPLVDRPWVRAGAEDVVYFAYNTGRDTHFHRSTDGGRTWGLPLYRTGAGLGDLGQGPENEHLYLVTGFDELTLHETEDGGATWTTESVPVPDSSGRVRDRRVPVADEAGNLWIAYAWGEKGVFDVHVVRRDPAGAWHGPFQASPEGGTHAYPWPAAMRDGTVAVAWYAAPWATVEERPASTPVGPTTYGVGKDDAWHVMVAVTLDGASAQPSFQRTLADPEPLLTGDLGRRLLDFLQVDVSPDGALHVAYAQDRDGDGQEHAAYVRSTTGLRLQPAVFPYGPLGGAGGASRDAAPAPLALG